MNERSHSTRVLIAGGGPAGIMLGYLLARSGVPVTVVEKWPDFFRDFRGDTIHPSTMEVLKELGLLEDFLRLPHNKMTRMTLHFGTSAVTIADLSSLRVTCPYIAFIPQWDFLNFIAEKARQYPQFELRMGTEAIDLIRENGRVTGVRAEDRNGVFDIRAELVVGADGRHSTVREKGAFEVEQMGVPIDVLWFRIARRNADDMQSLGYFDHGIGMVMLDRREYWQCGFIIEKGRFNELKAEGIEAFRMTITSLAHLPEGAADEVDSWEKVKLLSVTVDHAKTWAKDGVVLIGDAAHAMSPIGGVGINYAIQDAVAAANLLLPALKDGAPNLGSLSKIQARREKPTRRMQELQVYVQDHAISPLLRERTALRVPWFVRFFIWLPFLRRIPARIIGIGFQPEHIRSTLTHYS